MRAYTEVIWKSKTWRDIHGQSLVEYALMAGFLTCTCCAIMPDIALSVGTVFTKVLSVLDPVVNGTGAAPTG